MRLCTPALRLLMTLLCLFVALGPLTGCTDAILDVTYASGLDFVSGSVFGLTSLAIFGENPPSILFNSLLNSIGASGSGGGSGHNH